MALFPGVDFNYFEPADQEKSAISFDQDSADKVAGNFGDQYSDVAFAGFNPLQFAQGFAKNVAQKYREADKSLGGWLPGGGTASPVTRKAQEITKSVTPENIRDKVAIPILDKGIESGVIPAAPAMFARYLSGTSNTLTALPESIRQDVSKLASQKVDPQQTAQDIYGSAMHSRASQLWNQAWTDKKDEAISDIKSSLGPLSFLRQNDQNYLETHAQVSPIVQGEYQRLLEQDISPEKTKALAAKEAYLKAVQNRDPNTSFPVTNSQAYGNGRLGPSTLTLGSFTVNPRSQEVTDRYHFDDLEKGKNAQGMYPDALGGGRPAAFLIDFALNKGWITPESGYNIKAKY